MVGCVLSQLKTSELYILSWEKRLRSSASTKNVEFLGFYPTQNVIVCLAGGYGFAPLTVIYNPKKPNVSSSPTRKYSILLRPPWRRGSVFDPRPPRHEFMCLYCSVIWFISPSLPVQFSLSLLEWPNPANAKTLMQWSFDAFSEDRL